VRSELDPNPRTSTTSNFALPHFMRLTMHARDIVTTSARILLIATPLLAAASRATAQRGPRAEKPTGAEIALKARTARLDRANAGKGEFQGKPITFTPALLPPRADLASGQIIGVLENDVEGDETGLPPGKYDVFAARLEDGWHVYAASGGEIVREALRVEVVRRPGQPAEKKPRIRPKGWGVDIDYTPVRTFTPPPVATISLTNYGSPLMLGETRQYYIELRDAGGNVLTGRSITWTSSAPGIASTPSLGVAKGIAPGTATLTATSEGKSASVTVQVPQVSYQMSYGPAIRTSGSYTASISVGNPVTARASVSVDGCSGYANACPRVDPAAVTMSNSAPSIVKVERITGGSYSSWTNTDWRLTGLTEGTADLTFAYGSARTTVRLTVTAARAATIAVTPSPVTVILGQSQALTATMRDATGNVVAGPTVTWASDATSIADVTSTGRVAGVAEGTAVITVTGDGVTTSVPVRVAPVPVASVSVSPTPLSVEEDQWAGLTATVKDQAGNPLTGRGLVWTVNNPAIAEVTASGRVVGVAPGTAMVTATSEGRSGSVMVTVTAAAPEAAERPTETISFNW
jgi:uncharacterized protein YjdB